MGSVHNELTGRSGFVARAIRNALQIESGEVGIERISETLTPVINLWERPEWQLLLGTRLWGVAPSQPAVAAEFSQVGIANPKGSGLLVVVKELVASNHAGNPTIEIQLGSPIVPFTATSTPNSRDSRTALLTGVTTVSWTNHAAARVGSGALIAAAKTNGGTYARLILDVVLAPDSFLAFGSSIVNDPIAVSIFGYERPAFSGELMARA